MRRGRNGALKIKKPATEPAFSFLNLIFVLCLAGVRPLALFLLVGAAFTQAPHQIFQFLRTQLESFILHLPPPLPR